MADSAVSCTAFDLSDCGPFPPASGSTCDSSGPASFTSDVEGCDGYLVLTFTKPKTAEVKQTAAVDYIGNDGLQQAVETNHSCHTVSSVSHATPLSISTSNIPPPMGKGRFSRLEAVAAGVDPTQISSASILSASSFNLSLSSTSSSTVSASSEYVRRFTYPDGDTHYDWLSCPLAQMQGKKNPGPTRPVSLASPISRRPFLVYDSTLPDPHASSASASTGRAPLHRPPRFLASNPQSACSRKMLRCEECGKYYGNEYSLHHHICLKRKDVWKKGDVPTRLVGGQLTYFCPKCEKPFKWLGNLTRHYYVHTGQRFFKCDVCQKEFFSAYQVKRHMNSHTGHRFQCRICEKPFTCKYACDWHTRSHENN